MATQAQREEFSQALRQARNAASMSVRALAKAVDVSHAVVGQWEKGEHAPRPSRVGELERALSLPTGSLARLLGYLTADEAGTRVRMTVLEAAGADPKLSDRAREVLGAVYRELVRKPLQ